MTPCELLIPYEGMEGDGKLIDVGEGEGKDLPGGEGNCRLLGAGGGFIPDTLWIGPSMVGSDGW